MLAAYHLLRLIAATTSRLRIVLLHVPLELGLLVDVVLRDAVEGRTTGPARETEGHERRLVVDLVLGPDRRDEVGGGRRR